MLVKIICPQCKGHGYPPSTTQGFRKGADPEPCPTCQATGYVFEEEPDRPVPLAWTCEKCGRTNHASERFCEACLSPKPVAI